MMFWKSHDEPKKQRKRSAVEAVKLAGYGAAFVSGALGLVWVWGMVGEGVKAGSPFAIMAGLIMVALIGVSETFAVLMLLQWERRKAENAPGAARAALLIFAVAEIVNCGAAGAGVVSLANRLIEGQRAPLVAAFAEAQAAEAAAIEAVEYFDAQSASQAQRYGDELRGTREVAAMAVTARRGTLSAQDRAAEAREALRNKPCESAASCLRGGVVAQKTRAIAARETAQLKLASAPNGLEWWQEIAIAGALFLFKGPSVWASTAKRASTSPAKTGECNQKTSTRFGLEIFAKARGFWRRAPKRELTDVIEAASREIIRAMDREARAVLREQARRVAAWCQHAERAELAA
jgi:hypothetical protein